MATPFDATHFQPPAPVARVALRNPVNGGYLADIELLVDTGADITVLPIRAVERIGAALDSCNSIMLAGYDGQRSIAPVYALDLILGRKVFRGRYVGTPGARGFLGRDVLNETTLHVFGRALTWTIEI